MTTDAILTVAATTGLYDIQIDENGDIANDDFFDTAILYSIFGERRASPDEVTIANLRRGWIGNGDFENGSKIWLLFQSRLTRSAMNKLEDEAKKGLQWLVDDKLAVAISNVNATLVNGSVMLEVTIERTLDKINRKFFIPWNNTGTN